MAQKIDEKFKREVLEEVKKGYFKKPVTSETIAENLQVYGHRPEKAVIFAINALRKVNPFIGSKKNGYYYVRTAKQLAPTLSMLRSKRRGMSRTISLLEDGYNKLSVKEEIAKARKLTFTLSTPSHPIVLR